MENIDLLLFCPIMSALVTVAFALAVSAPLWVVFLAAAVGILIGLVRVPPYPNRK